VAGDDQERCLAPGPPVVLEADEEELVAGRIPALAEHRDAETDVVALGLQCDPLVRVPDAFCEARGRLPVLSVDRRTTPMAPKRILTSRVPCV
jgi:hypothetical protein